MKKPPTSGPCRMCGAYGPLCESHVIPSLACAWLKHQGSGHLRNGKAPNIRLQGGRKPRLLCSACEQRFCQAEAWFKSNVFDRYLNGQHVLPYDEHLFYFALSLLWRVLITSDLNRDEVATCRGAMADAETEWRAFLLGGGLTSQFSDVHLFLTDIGTRDGVQPVVNWSRYFGTAIDATITGGDMCIAEKVVRARTMQAETALKCSSSESRHVCRANGVS